MYILHILHTIHAYYICTFDPSTAGSPGFDSKPCKLSILRLQIARRPRIDGPLHQKLQNSWLSEISERGRRKVMKHNIENTETNLDALSTLHSHFDGIGEEIDMWQVFMCTTRAEHFCPCYVNWIWCLGAPVWSRQQMSVVTPAVERIHFLWDHQNFHHFPRHHCFYVCSIWQKFFLNHFQIFPAFLPRVGAFF